MCVCVGGWGLAIVLERRVREIFLEEVTFDHTWGKQGSKPHRNLAGVHLGRGNFTCKGPEAGRMSLGVGDRKANRAKAKSVKQSGGNEVLLIPSTKTFRFLPLKCFPNPCSLLFIPDVVLHYPSFPSSGSAPLKAVLRPADRISYAHNSDRVILYFILFHGLTQHCL